MDYGIIGGRDDGITGIKDEGIGSPGRLRGVKARE